ncbi:MAG: hypothetical protein WC460_02695 [Patescibacteria group bacterium]
MTIDDIVERYDKKALKMAIGKLEERLRVGDLGNEESARIWLQLSHLYEQAKDLSSSRFAKKQVAWFREQCLKDKKLPFNPELVAA